MNPNSRIFYQNPYRNGVFAGELPLSPIPNMDLSLIIRYYTSVDSFHFYLVLKNGITLSVSKDVKYNFLSIMQVRNGRITRHPDFDNDGFGESLVDYADLRSFVKYVSELFPRHDYVDNAERRSVRT